MNKTYKKIQSLNFFKTIKALKDLEISTLFMLIGGAFTAGLFVIELYNYFYYKGMFTILNIDMNLYDSTNKNLIYNGIFGIILMLLLFFGSYLLYKAKEEKAIIEKGKNFFCCCFVNIIFTIFTAGMVNIILIILTILFLLVFESIIIKSQFNHDDCENNKNVKSSYLNFFILLLITLTFIPWVMGACNAISMTKINTINNNEIILYTTKDYYITSPFEEKNNQFIVVDVSSHNKISTNNIKVITKQNIKVKIK